MKQKPSSPFELLEFHGESVTLDVSGNTLVLPTADNELELFNKKTLNSNRLTISESPWGGLKGSFSDGCVGTILVNLGDGIYLQDPNGENTSKELGAGKLYELGCLTVDITAHTITEEFYIVNQGDVDEWAVIEVFVPDYLANLSSSKDPLKYKFELYSYYNGDWFSNPIMGSQNSTDLETVDASCGGAYFLDGTSLQSYLETPNGYLASGLCYYGYGLLGENAAHDTIHEYYSDPTAPDLIYSSNYGAKSRIGFSIKMPALNESYPSRNKIKLKLVIYYDDVNKALSILKDSSGNGNHGTMSVVGLVADSQGNPYGAMSFNGVNSYVNCGSAPVLHAYTAFTLHARIKLPSLPSIDVMLIGDYNGAYKGYRFYIETTGKVVLKVGRFSDTSFGVAKSLTPLQSGIWYDIFGIYDGSKVIVYIGTVASIGDNFAPIEAETSNVIIGAALWGSAYFAVIIKEIKKYNRVLSVDEIQLICDNQPVSSTDLVASWQPTTPSHLGETTHKFSNTTDASHGLQNIIKPWMAIYDPTKNIINFYLFTHKPKYLEFKRDETGNIHEFTLYPGNGLIYHGQITHSNLILDSNSDAIPDVLDASKDGSITKFLQTYGMVENG